MNVLQIHSITAYPPSCLVRDDANRPKTATIGGVARGRISSSALKRAIRVSEDFARSLEGHLGVRTQRIGEIVLERLKADVGEEAATAAIARIVEAFGKPNGAKPLRTEQLAFVDPKEIDAAVLLAIRLAGGEVLTDEDLEKARKALITPQVTAVDIGLFGRMFADRGEVKMTAAAAVAHPFTVGKALVETDFYVAVDDAKNAEEDLGAGFMGHQGFVSGAFYGYVSIDRRQLLANLGGDADLAARGVAAFIRALATVSPGGKSASFGSHARAHFMMLETGDTQPRTLAGAFHQPVSSEDQIDEAIRRVNGLAEDMDLAYGDRLDRTVMNVAARQGTLDEVIAAAVAFVKA